MSKPTKGHFFSIESVPIGEIVPYENNAKKHSDEQVTALAESIKKLGFDQPIVLDGKKVIIKGHGRWMAVKKLGWPAVPVIIRKDLTDEQAMALRLADNKLASTDYDAGMLQEELRRIHELDAELIDISGFTAKELAFLEETVDDLDDSVIRDDLSDAVQSSQDEANARADEIGKSEVPVSKVLGFKSVSATQERIIFRLMATIENETGMKGADALAAFADDYCGGK